jgi:hypothetical protein
MATTSSNLISGLQSNVNSYFQGYTPTTSSIGNYNIQIDPSTGAAIDPNYIPSSGLSQTKGGSVGTAQDFSSKLQDEAQSYSNNIPNVSKTTQQQSGGSGAGASGTGSGTTSTVTPPSTATQIANVSAQIAQVQAQLQQQQAQAKSLGYNSQDVSSGNIKYDANGNMVAPSYATTTGSGTSNTSGYKIVNGQVVDSNGNPVDSGAAASFMETPVGQMETVLSEATSAQNAEAGLVSAGKQTITDQLAAAAQNLGLSQQQVQLSYNTAIQQNQDMMYRLSGSAGVSGQTAMNILDQHSDLINGMNLTLAQLQASYNQAVTAGDDQQTTLAAQGMVAYNNIASTAMNQMISLAQTQQTNAQNQITTAVSTGALAYMPATDLANLATQANWSPDTVAAMQSAAVQTSQTQTNALLAQYGVNLPADVLPYVNSSNVWSFILPAANKAVSLTQQATAAGITATEASAASSAATASKTAAETAGLPLSEAATAAALAKTQSSQGDVLQRISDFFGGTPGATVNGHVLGATNTINGTPVTWTADGWVSTQ